VRALQRVGLVLAPAHHAVHHQAPFDRRYCITTGLLNPWLDRVGLFRALEALVRPPRRRRRASHG
jgi:ubiquitin-conjugating enzyme E2 variant